MLDRKNEVFAFCQFCKEKREVMNGTIKRKKKLKILHGQCLICRRNVQLIVPKRFKL